MHLPTGEFGARGGDLAAQPSKLMFCSGLAGDAGAHPWESKKELAIDTWLSSRQSICVSFAAVFCFLAGLFRMCSACALLSTRFRVERQDID